MIKRTKGSVVFRIITMMISVILMAFISIFSSVYISDISEYDGQAINLAGSMRMMSYRLATQQSVIKESPQAEHINQQRQHIEEFDELITASIFQKDFGRFDVQDIEQEYLLVLNQWQQSIKPLLTEQLDHDDLNTIQIEELLPAIEQFVAQIDQFVKSYQELLENRLAMLRAVQMVTLFITLVLICLSIYNIYYYIALPLRELTQVAYASVKGDLTQRSSVQQKDELGLLSQTLNDANDRIIEVHENLEQTVLQKTAQLKQNNEWLKLLYDIANQMTTPLVAQLDYQAIISRASEILELNNLDLCLTTAESNIPFDHIITNPNRQIPQSCANKACDICFQGGTVFDESIAINQHRYPIVFKDEHFGVIVANCELERPLSAIEHKLINALALQLGTAMSITNQTDQQRRIALLHERAIIARELHDSLAQALSYLKIQVARLEKGMKNMDQAQIEPLTPPVLELKEGLSSAYRQLRELLTTFRLQITNAGFEVALKDTIEQLSSRTNIDIKLDYQCANLPFNPNEQIHLLQITKEALQNAINHSQGSQVIIHYKQHENKQVEVRISDDGIGLQNAYTKLNHYGTVIMKERAKSLHSELKMFNNEQGGATVAFEFMPSVYSAYLTQ